jgi:dephospho-CoA kinase
VSYLLGLTGSIGMGKSTTCALFAERGCLIWDADLTVHQAYGRGGAAVGPVSNILPQVIEKKQINREKLRQIISEDPTILPQIEAIIHPLVQQNRNDFISANPSSILVFDIPLLFELNAEADFDAVACVFSEPEIQKKRVMNRPGMTKIYFEMILRKQLPVSEKVSRSDYVINTATSKTAEIAVDIIIKNIRRKLKNA